MFHVNLQECNWAWGPPGPLVSENPNHELACHDNREAVRWSPGPSAHLALYQQKRLFGKRGTRDHERQLVGGFSPTHLKNMSQIGSFPQFFGMKIPKNVLWVATTYRQQLLSSKKTSNFPDQTWGNNHPQVWDPGTSRKFRLCFWKSWGPIFGVFWGVPKVGWNLPGVGWIHLGKLPKNTWLLWACWIGSPWSIKPRFCEISCTDRCLCI